MSNITSIEKFDEEESFNRRATELFISLIKQTLQKRYEVFVALSGGTTPFPIFKMIKEKFLNYIDWGTVNFFWVDERAVPPAHKESNFGNANRELLEYLPGVKVYRLKGEIPQRDAVHEYKSYLKKMLPFEDGLPCFDLIWLGMGTDGHTASIFPNSEVIDERNEWVKGVWVDKLDAYRLTLTFPVINNARNRMILVRGAKKLKIFNEIQELEEKKYPIQYIYPSNAKDYWIVGTN